MPVHYDPKKVNQVWKVNYEMLATEAPKWAKRYGVKPATSDRTRFGVMAIDDQITFCIPDYELYVGGRSGTGAVDDSRRLVEFVYRNLGIITGFEITMDTHVTQQIFHAMWLVDKNGNHPGPYTEVSSQDVVSGKWMVNPAVIAKVPGANYAWFQGELLDYCAQLEAAKRYKLTIWPYHAMLGGVGHALVPSFHEAVMFHSFVREVDPHTEIKGGNPLSENYSALRAEVLFAMKQAIAQKSTGFVKSLMAYDYLAIVGQAKSHCYSWTVDDFLTEIVAVDPSLAKKIYLVEDCTSPVVVPGVVDHTDAANAAFARFAKAGMNIVKSTDPVESWPGIKL
jgi:nicotinamidase-related amidase